MNDVWDTFKEAVERSNAETVRTLLREHPELQDRLEEPAFSFGRTALIAASNAGSEEVMELLLAAGADIDAYSEWEAGPFNALHHQVASDDPRRRELADFLIGRGANIDLHSAAGLGMIDLLERYIDADPSRVSEPGPDGATPLHLALDEETARWLLDHGVELERRCVDHNSTPAMWAIGERPGVMRFLIEQGAEPDLFMAAVLNDPMLVKRVLEKDPDAIRSRTREGPFAHPPDGGDIYIWALDFIETPHEVARLRGNQQVYRYLMERSPRDIKLVQMAREGDFDAMQELLEIEPELIKEMPDQLHWHLMCQAPEAVVLAVRHGGDPNVRNRDGVTPLHQAAWQGEVEKARCLVEQGADPETRDTRHSSTPLGWASYNEQQAVVDYLADKTPA